MGFDIILVDNGESFDIKIGEPLPPTSFDIPLRVNSNFDIILSVTTPIGNIKYFNGLTFELKQLKVYNGISWENALLKYYNGSTWIIL